LAPQSQGGYQFVGVASGFDLPQPSFARRATGQVLLDASRVGRFGPTVRVLPQDIFRRAGGVLNHGWMFLFQWGLLIFPDLLTNWPPNSKKSCENMAFPSQSKCLTHSTTEKSTSPETAVDNYATLKETKAV
jgi:hypothetical protein